MKKLSRHLVPLARHIVSGYLMSQTGRFLECIACRLSFVFPPGSRYETIAKQFESHLCQSATTRASESSQSPGPELDLQG